MNKKMIFEELNIEVVQKNIKNINLRIYSPDGRVKVTVPKNLSLKNVKEFIMSKLDWIRKHQEKICNQKKNIPLMFVDGESHYINGEVYPLKIIEHNKPAKVKFDFQTLIIYIRPEMSLEKKQSILNEWYRKRLKSEIPDLIQKYEKIMNVKVLDFGIKKMKTKWGTCNIRAKRIWLNLELAKKESNLLEYIVVHEMVHLLEPSHNTHFYKLMNQFMSNWKLHDRSLNNKSL